MSSHSPTIDLAIQLMACRSVTPIDDGCQDIMIARLQAIGFRVERLRFDDVDNFWAVHGDSGDILAFAGHTDVVPAGDEDQWQYPPYHPRVEKGLLCGRGAADMKGSLAAMITATEAFISIHPNHPNRLAFLITSDEEGIAINGTARVMDYLAKHNETIRWCVVGEPSSTAATGDTIKNGRRGSLGLKLTVHGVQGHVAYPHLADNPIFSFSPALVELNQTEWDRGNDFFPATSFQISNIQAGTGATNVIPGDLYITANFRFSTELTVDDIKQRLTAILDRHGLQFSIEWHLSGLPFITERGELIDASAKAIEQVTGLNTELSTAGGTSDGRFIAPTGAQLVELGPVNKTIHRVNERVNAAELDQLHAIYEKIMIALLSD
ncbi:MAG: succinyl-diaminopimelate desuccinylase [Cellvibrionales bacterium]|nr:succinyl-diaminopimelate desuccinylase [Cellvibrionales bacterium]|tara:strand:- start:6347 stop:7486 length:1140 start_codon:yes stop_codon:yes gene_type:complete